MEDFVQSHCCATVGCALLLLLLLLLLWLFLLLVLLGVFCRCFAATAGIRRRALRANRAGEGHRATAVSEHHALDICASECENPTTTTLSTKL